MNTGELGAALRLLGEDQMKTILDALEYYGWKCHGDMKPCSNCVKARELHDTLTKVSSKV